MELQNGEQTYISADKEQLENAMITEYEAKYRLARSSLFIHEPLASLLGPMALNDNARNIVQGKFFCPPGLKRRAFSH